MHGAPVLYTKVCTSYMHKSICKSMHTCAMLTNTETRRTTVGERSEISTKESTSNITISFVQSISHQKIQTFFNSRPLVLSASLPWGAGTSIVLFTLLSKWGQLLLYTFKYMTMRMEFKTPYSRFVVKGTTPHSKLPSTWERGSPSWHFLGQGRGICLFYEYFILLCTQSLHILRIWGPPTYSRYLVKGTTSHSTNPSTPVCLLLLCS